MRLPLSNQAALCLGAILMLVGCGGGANTGAADTSPTITSVTVSCSLVSIQSNQTSQCTASVQGTGSLNTSVTWAASTGTINSNGLYTPPSNVTNAITVTITATSTQDASKTGTATVIVNPASTVTLVTVTCLPSSIQSNQTSQCTASVQGTGSLNTSVTWAASTGTINSNGLYTPPSNITNATTVAITATWTQDASKTGTATVIVNPASTVTLVTVTCLPSSIQSNQTSQCTASVQGTGSLNTSVTWAASTGTINSNGLYTPPSNVTNTITVSVTATSVQDTTKSGSNALTVFSPTITSVTVTCTPTQVPVNGTSQCTPTVAGSGGYNNSVTWSVSGGGTINSNGLYTAPATVPSPATVSVTATSVEDTTKSGNFALTIFSSSNLGFSPPALNFANETTGGASSPQQVTLTNTGNATLKISQIGVSGANPQDFQETSTCGTSVPPNGTCTLSITFVPTSGGSRSAALNVTYNGGSQSLPLAGQGLAAAVTISVSTLQFGNETVGTPSGSRSVLLTNQGSAALTITSISVIGANSGDFNQNNNCPITPASLAAGSACTVNVTFTPSILGGETAMLSISDYVQGSPQTINLFGNGLGSIAVAVSPVSAMLQTGAIQQFTATVSNTSNSSVTWSVNGIQGGNGTIGTIDMNGNYAAPLALPNPSSVTITATSQADPTKSGSVSVTIITRSLVSLHDFNAAPTSNQPPSGLIQGSNGLLYGTTFGQGAYGSLYSMTTGGQSFSVLYSITNENNGYPLLNLMQGKSGDIYGTTPQSAGTTTYGTVFDFSSASVLYPFTQPSFNGVAVGAYPRSPAMVQDSQGNLYGYGNGGIFQLSPPNTFTTFTPLCPFGTGDGQTPSSLLLGIDGNLYGTTEDGGPTSEGEIFKCTQQGNLSILHAFGGADGNGPVSLVQTSDGTLWGVTHSGGANNYGGVFKVQSSDDFVDSIVFSIVYSSIASTAGPDAIILGADGNFYGTTIVGGANGDGTIFEMTPSGIPSALYNFTGAADGAFPFALIQGQGGTFYGMAQTTLTGFGEVFSFGVSSGTVPVVSLSNYSLAFGDQAVGTTSPVDFLTIINTGTGNLTFTTNISITGANAGDFALQDVTCSQGLAAGAACNMQVTFTPSVSGQRNAAILISDNAAGSPQVVPLSGNGTGGGGGGGASPIANVSPASLGFGNQTVGVTSGAYVATLSNTGNADLSIVNISRTGSNAADFAETSNCPIAPAMLAPNQSCTIATTFTPEGSGIFSASVAVTDNASDSPQTVTLSGTGASGGSGGPPPMVTLEVTAADAPATPGYAGSVTIAWTSSDTTGCTLSVSPFINGLQQNVGCSNTGLAVNLPINGSATSPQPYTFTVTAPNPDGPSGTASVTVYALPSVSYGGGTPFNSLTNEPASSWGCEYYLGIPLGCGINYGLSNDQTAENDGLALALDAGFGFIGAVTGDQDVLSATYGPFSPIPPAYTQYLSVQPAAGIVSIQACLAFEGGAGSGYYYQLNDSNGNTWPWNSQTSSCAGLPSGDLGNFVQQAIQSFQTGQQVGQDAVTLFQSSQSTVEGLVQSVGNLVQLVLDLETLVGGPVSASVQVLPTCPLDNNVPPCIPQWNPVLIAPSGYTLTSTFGGVALDVGLGGIGQLVIADTVIKVSGVAAKVTNAPVGNARPRQRFQRSDKKHGTMTTGTVRTLVHSRDQ